MDQAKLAFENKPEVFKDQFDLMLSRFASDQRILIEVTGSASPDGNISNNQVIALNRTAAGIQLFKDLYDASQDNSALDVSVVTNAPPIFPPPPYLPAPNDLQITVTGTDRSRVVFRSKGVTNNDTDGNSYVMDRGIFYRLYTIP